MDVYLLDRDFEAVDIVEGYTSFIWTERYVEYGDFQIKIPLNHPLVNEFSNDRYIRHSDSNYLMVIRTVSVSRDVDSGDFLVITGRSMESILQERILFPNTEDGEFIYEGSAGALARNIVNHRMVRGDREDPLDAIPNLIALHSQNSGTYYTLSTKATDLYEVTKELCGVDDQGFRIFFDPSDKMLRFRVYSGRDLSEEFIFGPSFENIFNVERIVTTEDYKNVAYVFHKDYSDSPIVVYRSGHTNASGHSRRVVYVDASSLENPTLSELRRQGRDILNSEKHRWTSVFDGEISDHSIEYGVDYDMGDIVLLRDFGTTSKVRITEYIRSYDSEGFKEYPSFEEVE